MTIFGISDSPAGIGAQADQAKVGGEPIIEAVHYVAKEAARTGLVPRFGVPAFHQSGQALGVALRFDREGERGGTDSSIRSLPVELQVALHLAALFFEQEREEEPRTYAPAQPSGESGPRRRTWLPHFMAVFREQSAPDRDVPVLDFCELGIDCGFAAVRFRPGQLAVQKRSIGLIGEMMQPDVRDRG